LREFHCTPTGNPVLVEPGVVYGEVVHGARVPCCTGYCTPLAGTWVPHCTPLVGTWVPRGHTEPLDEDNVAPLRVGNEVHLRVDNVALLVVVDIDAPLAFDTVVLLGDGIEVLLGSGIGHLQEGNSQGLAPGMVAGVR